MRNEEQKIKAFLTTIREHSRIINEQLALLLIVVGKIRSNYLSIDETIEKFEEEMKK